jgi:hypothetical protein
VENAEAVPVTRTFLPAVPQSPDFYALNHPTRIEKFRCTGESRTLMKPERDRSPWRHGLEHDVESVFSTGLLSCSLWMAHPKRSWALMLGGATDHNNLVRMIAEGSMLTNLTHSTYKPLGPLIMDLASILEMDPPFPTRPHWSGLYG